jgi:hypothetical protein
MEVLTGFVSADEKALDRRVGASTQRWRRKQARAEDFLPALIRARLQRCRPLKAKCT